MGDKTGIEWTDATWNPIRGCSRISQGCVNCYAEKVAARFSGPGLAYEGLVNVWGQWNGTIKVVPEHMADPLRWRRRRRIFVNSMSDLFHHDVPLEVIETVFGVMALSHERHIFQVLTKRAAAMRQFMVGAQMRHESGVHMATVHAQRAMDELGIKREHINIWPCIHERPSWPLPNVWMGVSVEDERVAHRIGDLQQTPAAVRWLSVEPLIGPLDLRGRLDGIHWVVVGGESGVGARPCREEWVTDVVHACQAAQVPVFVKQLGAVWSGAGSVTHRKGADMAEWPEALRVREFPVGVTP